MKPLLQIISIPKFIIKQVGIDFTQLPEVNGYKRIISRLFQQMGMKW